jgi:hypothetical protein
MPTIMTHAMAAWGLGRVLTRFRRRPVHLWLLAGDGGLAGETIPDAMTRHDSPA